MLSPRVFSGRGSRWSDGRPVATRGCPSGYSVPFVLRSTTVSVWMGAAGDKARSVRFGRVLSCEVDR